MQKFKSDKSIGQDVYFKDQESEFNYQPKYGKVIAVKFTVAQVFYDIEDMINLGSYKDVHASLVKSVKEY